MNLLPRQLLCIIINKIFTMMDPQIMPKDVTEHNILCYGTYIYENILVVC